MTKKMLAIVTLCVSLLFLCSCDPNAVIKALWEASGHADATAEAFTHWDEDDPAEISTSCAKCHSEAGFLDFVADGTVDSAVPAGSGVIEGITCDTCHTDSTTGAVQTVTSVTFPSGVEITGLGAEAMCMQCHQGRESGTTLEATFAGVTDEDNATSTLGFKNIHYYAAGATLYGSQTKGGYEYADGGPYQGLTSHPGSMNSCTECHNNHSLEVRVDSCTPCHSSVTTASDLTNIRSQSTDWDGDSNTTEGISAEITGLQVLLLAAIQTYATDTLGTDIAYDSHAYPYFFIDTNGNGTADTDEANYGNKYNAWSARLLKAAYNYQTSLKDPGAYSHNPKYILQLLTDSIADLEGTL